MARCLGSKLSTVGGLGISWVTLMTSVRILILPCSTSKRSYHFSVLPFSQRSLRSADVKPRGKSSFQGMKSWSLTAKSSSLP